MSWNYRLVRCAADNSLAIHEVYYDKDGRLTTMTTDPVPVISEEIAGIGDVLLMMRSACRLPILAWVDGALIEEKS